jgi:hypothetical protein
VGAAREIAGAARAGAGERAALVHCDYRQIARVLGLSIDYSVNSDYRTVASAVNSGDRWCA